MQELNKKGTSRRFFLKQSTLMAAGFLTAPSWPTALQSQVDSARQNTLVAVILGDSVMWGQGLDTADKFSTLATQALGRKLNRVIEIKADLSHSGAVLESTLEQRKKFANVNPARFAWSDFRPGKSTQIAEDFVNTSKQDEAPTLFFHGELPSPFPTVNYQVKIVANTIARTAELVLINGGANDLDFETFLNPTKDRDNFVHKYEPLLEKYTYTRVSALITKARKKFPNAAILYTGYFSPFAPGKSNGQVRNLFEDLSGYERYKISVNKFLNYKNPDQLVTEAQLRSQFGLSRGLYYSRKAIAELNNNPETRGPGILFIHPCITPNETVFTNDSCFHRDYKPSTVKDRAKEVRWQKIPRIDRQREMGQVLLNLTLGYAIPHAKALLKNLDGSKDLVNGLKNYITSPSNANNFKLRNILKEEINRIDHAKIASFLHPNERGARKYADAIVLRYIERLHNVNLRDDLNKFSSIRGNSQTEQLSLIFRRYGLQAYNTSPQNASQLMLVDSIALEIRTTADSEKLMYDNIYLELGNNLRWQLNFPFEYIDLTNFYIKRLHNQFNPGFTDFFTIDGMGLHLSLIKKFELIREKIGTSPFVGKGDYSISRLALYINGIKVYASDTPRKLARDQRISYPFPLDSQV